MQDFKKALLPLRHGIPFSQDQCLKTLEEKECMQLVPYASVVDSLMYAMLRTRTNICFVVGIVSRYQSNPGPEHWTIFKHTLKCLRRMRDYVLMLQSIEIA